MNGEMEPMLVKATRVSSVGVPVGLSTSIVRPCMPNKVSRYLKPKRVRQSRCLMTIRVMDGSESTTLLGLDFDQMVMRVVRFGVVTHGVVCPFMGVPLYAHQDYADCAIISDASNDA